MEKRKSQKRNGYATQPISANKKLITNVCKTINDTLLATEGTTSLITSDKLTTIQVIGLLQAIETNCTSLSRLLRSSIETLTVSLSTECPF